MNKTAQMKEEKIPKLLLKFSLPAIVGLLVNSLYNIVDSIFIGRGIGDMGLAAVTVSFPIVTSFVACIMLIGMGGTVLISIRLGEKNETEAEEIIGNALVLFLIIGISLTIFGLIFLKPILTLFGASPTLLPLASDYLRIILIGSVFLAIGTGMNNFIRAEGNPKVAMNTMLIGTITNIILDYIFIFIFHWGIKGAALATIISYSITSTWVLYYFFSGNSMLKIRIENFRLRALIIKSILIAGFPTFILQLSGSIQQLVLNRSLAHYGGDMALAVIGIIMSIVTFLVMPAMGISQGAQPIIGYNYGAKELGRVKSTLKFSAGSATFVVTLGFIFSKLWPAQLIGLFNQDPQLIDMGTHAMGIFFKFIPLVGLQMISSGYFQAVGKPNQATLLGLSRQVFIFIPLLLILPHYFGLEGVWWSGPFSDLGAFILTGVWLLYEIRHLNKAASHS
ncbi:MAG: MATE family efflux transporter [Clostridiales bacterium]|nr:MATE family efflux transporter [Clostridiales bacterium]